MKQRGYQDVDDTLYCHAKRKDILLVNRTANESNKRLEIWVDNYCHALNKEKAKLMMLQYRKCRGDMVYAIYPYVVVEVKKMERAETG